MDPPCQGARASTGGPRAPPLRWELPGKAECAGTWAGNNDRPMTNETGEVEAVGKVLSFGRRVAFSEAQLTDSKGRLLASATSTLLVFEIPPPKAA